MIKKLDHQNIATARKIRAVFQVSYAVEAELLKAADFPPLKRPLEGFTGSSNEFFGFFEEKELAGVMEIDEKKDSVHIQSLVVQPKFFRKGIGKKLVDFAFSNYKTKLFTVETGAANGPATNLYLQTGFTKLEEFDTDHGIRKVRFEKPFI
ncbi:GNAT family N-acetyltransferase [Christiangramia fulva]|uniref:GNAT family N-acetyltransferase n=1 Tax=Christiangramia fulva TaxID=2126553 RepID=A0A2R3Z2R5_9FLAO|nr:GNAT family N-acetyltransferase [Christiangramia fulva]AVR44573.1 GNAT family N-acetyltransferase [Christiangramia fulva]